MTARPAATRADSSLAAAVLDILRSHRGQENAVSREQLLPQVTASLPLMSVVSVSRRLRVSRPVITDRQVRDAITALRLDGHLIANLGTGYFVCNTPDELAAYLGQERARTRTLEAVLRAMESSPEAARLSEQLE